MKNLNKKSEISKTNNFQKYAKKLIMGKKPLNEKKRK